MLVQIFGNLRFQLTDFLLVLVMVPNTVLVDEAYQGDGNGANQHILQCLNTADERPYRFQFLHHYFCISFAKIRFFF